MKKRKNNLIYIFILLNAFLVSNCEKENKDNSSNNLTGTFTDSRDGNIYKTVKIGEQIWMAENLKYLPSVVSTDIRSTTAPCYYVYGYEGSDVSFAKSTSNYKNYGVLYNWVAAVNSCPTGWHLPSHDEWTELIDYLGSFAGDKLKEIGTTHWASPNNEASDEVGFSALPGGDCNYGGFNRIGQTGNWWSDTESIKDISAFYRSLSSNNSNVGSYALFIETGFSVRCIKD